MRVSTNLPEGVRESGREGVSQGHASLQVSDPEGLRQKLIIAKPRNMYALTKLRSGWLYTHQSKNNNNIQFVDKMKLLDTIINDRPTWNDNCQILINKTRGHQVLP